MIDKEIKRKKEEQFNQIEGEDNWYRCKECGEKVYCGEKRTEDLLEHLDSHE